MFIKLIKLISLLYMNTLIKSQDCFLEVPADPLNTGLFQPWFVSTNPISTVRCSQTISTSAVFVEATILDTITGNLFVYNPLVIDIGTQPAISPVVGILPSNNIVIINIGINGVSITLIPSLMQNSIQVGNCVNGLPNGTIFGQVAYCNGLAFFAEVNKLISSGLVVIPLLKNTLLGDICPTTRNFGVVDQDQSDNVITQYIITTAGTIAQDTSNNRNNLSILQIITNGSDNRLLSLFINPAIGCMSFAVPDLVDNLVLRSSLALNEIQANTNSIFPIPIALVHPNDPMVLDKGQISLEKINLYRVGVNQQILQIITGQENLDYCNGLNNFGVPFIILHQNEFANFKSPDITANNLLNFLCRRYTTSWVNLKCDILTGKPSIITVVIEPNTNTVISNNLASLTPVVPTWPIVWPIVWPVPTIPIIPTPITIPTNEAVPTMSTALTTILVPTIPIIPTNEAVPTMSTVLTTILVPTVSPIPIVIQNSTYINLCGNSYNNVNCDQTCSLGLDTQCITPNFRCFRVLNITSICNYNNFCGTNTYNITCSERCPLNLNTECITNGLTCFKVELTICNSNINSNINSNNNSTISPGLINNSILIDINIYIIILFLFISMIYFNQ